MSGDFAIDDGLPSWRSGQAIGEVRAISGTAFAVSGVDTDIIDAWGTLPLVPPAMLVSAANGGHNDASDNGVYSINLMDDAPTWVERIARSASVTADADYMPDGKPVSRHGYHHAHYISQRGRVMLFGAQARYSTASNGFKVDGVTVTPTWAWDAAGTWPDVLTANSFGGAHDPTTGNVLTDNGRIWTQATNSWAVGSGFAGQSWRWPITYWPTEDCYFALQWGDGQGFSSGVVAQRVNKTTAAASAITFNASAALTQFVGDAPQYAGMDWDAANGRFLFFQGSSSVTRRIYAITPNSGSTWDISIITTTGAAIPAGPGTSPGAGINGRFRYIAALGGFALMPTAASGIYFLRTH